MRVQPAVNGRYEYFFIFKGKKKVLARIDLATGKIEIWDKKEGKWRRYY